MTKGGGRLSIDQENYETIMELVKGVEVRSESTKTRGN